MTQVIEKKTLGKRECARIYKEADAAGSAAAEAAVPTPMIVGTPTTPLGNDIDFKKQTYFVADGLCGFAWVKIFPARGVFVTYLKKAGIGSTNGYEGGYDIWVRGYGQSVTRKEEYAQAFAKVLNSYGINAYAQSRLD